MKCSFCSAPLPKSGLICNYCSELNQLNRRLLGEKTLSVASNLNCPVCEINLETIEVEMFSFHHCTKCDGLFSSEEELEKVIEYQIKKENFSDHKMLRFIQDNPRDKRKKSVYHPCPICKKMMQHINYKQRSGVVLDVCEEHGIWLDGGELRQISDWCEVG